MAAFTPVSGSVQAAVAPRPEENEFGEFVRRKADGRPDYSVADPMEAISGFTNYSPQQMRWVADAKQRLVEVYQKNGFTAIDTRPIEYAELLQKKGGLTNQMYILGRLQDASPTKLGVPFDRTVPMAIFIAQHVNELTFPYLRYDIGWAFRGEHAKKGRYRAFIQCDVDIVDRKPSIKADAQALVTTIEALRSIGIPDCHVFVNHIAIAKSFMKQAGIRDEFFDAALRAIDKLKPENEREVVDELVKNIPGMTKEKAQTLLTAMSYEGPFADFRIPEGFPEEGCEGLRSLRQTEEMVRIMGVAPGTLRFKPSLTRGLDYYTGIVCETFIPGKERYGSIASGGRYDKLIDGLSDQNTGLCGVGFSIGLTRLFDVLQELDRVDLRRQTVVDVLVTYRTEAQFQTALALATALRERGVKTEVYMGDQKIPKQIGLADKKGIPFTAMVMNDNELILKDLTRSAQKEANQTTYTRVNDFVVGTLGALTELRSR